MRFNQLSLHIRGWYELLSQTLKDIKQGEKRRIFSKIEQLIMKNLCNDKLWVAKVWKLTDLFGYY